MNPKYMPRRFDCDSISARCTHPRGGHLPWFWVRMCGWSPRTPPHSYTRPSEKHDPFIYFPHRKLTPFIYYFWKLTPFIYYFSKFTHSYTFWVKTIPHWYTFDVKMIPMHILGGLKSIPHSSRTSVYTFIMEVTPPCTHHSDTQISTISNRLIQFLLGKYK